MNRALILACGNVIRGDDGVAPFIARYLASNFCDPQTEIISSAQWTPELAEIISQSELVIFLDSSAVLPPGEVHTERVKVGASHPGRLTHSVNPGELLALAMGLYGRAPEDAYLLTIGGQSFEHEEKFSEPVRLSIPDAITQIKALLSGVSQPESVIRSHSASS